MNTLTKSAVLLAFAALPLSACQADMIKYSAKMGHDACFSAVKAATGVEQNDSDMDLEAGKAVNGTAKFLWADSTSGSNFLCTIDVKSHHITALTKNGESILDDVPEKLRKVRMK